MKAITKYIAYDGREFTNEAECVTHEYNVDLAKNIMVALGDKPDGCDFANGHGYIRHYSPTANRARRDYLEFCKRYSDHKWIQQSIDDASIDTSWAGRIIGECAPPSISAMWNRFSCIDSEGREWGQAYYAANPEKGEQKQLN